MVEFEVGKASCQCSSPEGPPRLVALTGGPGAGKTAVLEMSRHSFCRHVAVLPESAGIIFGGGFPRNATPSARKAAQRSIYRVQFELERLAQEMPDLAVVLCDRGTVDGRAYWPETEVDTYWQEVGSSEESEYARYHAVVHLRTPAASMGYNHHNALRIESAADAAAVDLRILDAWGRHPRRHVIDAEHDFAHKAVTALMAIRDNMPDCCRTHEIRGE